MLTALLLSLSLGADPRSVLEARTTVSLDRDGCIDHAVKELGMSAKRVEGERRWNIKPQFLHPSVVEGGSLGVSVQKGERDISIVVTASWPGASKDAATQPELESRISAMARKLGQVCGTTEPVITCTLTPAGGNPRACPAP